MTTRNQTAQRLAARARRQGAQSAADTFQTTESDWRRFEQSMAALSYVDAATTDIARDAARTYVV